jgi:hypothetical protein
LIQNSSKRGWFYLSKGLNVLFFWAGKIAAANPKGVLPTPPNPKPTPPNASLDNSQWRRSYVEALTMVFRVDSGRGQDAGTGMDVNRSHATNDKERSTTVGRAVEGGGAMKGEPSIMLDVTIWAMREAERMADMQGAGRDVPIRDIGILNLCSMAVLGKEVVIMWPVRMLLSKLDLAQHCSTKRQLRWRTHVVRLLPLILRRKTGYRRQER